MAKAITREEVEDVEKLIEENVLNPLFKAADQGKWVWKNWAYTDYGAGAYVSDAFLAKELSTSNTEQMMIAKVLCLLKMLQSQNKTCANLYNDIISSQDGTTEDTYKCDGLNEFFMQNSIAFGLTTERALASVTQKPIDAYLEERIQGPVLNPLNELLKDWLEKDPKTIQKEEIVTLRHDLEKLCSKENLMASGYISSSTLGNSLPQVPGIWDYLREKVYNTALAKICDVAVTGIAGSAAARFALGSAALTPIGVILSICGPTLARKLVSEEHISKVLQYAADKVIQSITTCVNGFYEQTKTTQNDDDWLIVEDPAHTTAGTPISEADAATEGASATTTIDAEEQVDPTAGTVTSEANVVEEGDSATTTIDAEEQVDPTAGTLTSEANAAAEGASATTTIDAEEQVDPTAGTLTSEANAAAEGASATTTHVEEQQAVQPISIFKPTLNSTEHPKILVAVDGTEENVTFMKNEGSNFYNLTTDVDVTFDESNHALIGGQKVLFPEGLKIRVYTPNGIFELLTSFGTTERTIKIHESPPSSPLKCQDEGVTPCDLPLVGDSAVVEAGA